MGFPFLPSNLAGARFRFGLLNCGCERGRRFTATGRMQFDELFTAPRRESSPFGSLARRSDSVKWGPETTLTGTIHGLIRVINWKIVFEL